MPPSRSDRGFHPGLADDLAGAALALARWFTAGATLWCVAPRWEPHAQHIALEFLHPVVAGTPALPAAALTGPALVDTARVSARAGDIVLAVAASDEAEVRSLVTRGPAWGVHTIWIGSGPHPGAVAADHLLWLDDPDPRISSRGDFVLLYHVLWELTVRCFDHPALMRPEAESPSAATVHPDLGQLGEVVTPLGDGTARVRTATGTETVATSFVEPVHVGDLVLVHAGMAVSAVGMEEQR
ncbi:HypC/HybG/HupF family hydrogenase formation chaperone [Nocardia sp. NPDC024068]|uniref:HypC/HybG/HupF family hydrogenase formation chaperone n=1 Tax=Nocardia sp. NPDC024068 TaxID=3157197 RepID=UPI0033D8799E